VFLVECGATTHIVNNEAGFIDTDTTFNPSDYFLELVDGTQTNNIVKKKGTVLTHFQTKDGTLMEVKLSDVLFIPTVDILRTSSYKERL